MQHTEQYQFNLIETSDHLSPEPINDNIRKVEAELSGWSIISPPLLETTLEQSATQFTVSVEGLEPQRFHYILVDLFPPEGYTNYAFVSLQLNDSTRYNRLSGLYEYTTDYLVNGKLISCRYPRPRARMVLATYRDPDAYIDGIMLNLGCLCGSLVQVSEWTSFRLFCQSGETLPAGMRVVLHGVR